MNTTSIQADNIISEIANKPEISLLLCCARTNVEDKVAERIKSLLQQDINWSYLLTIAVQHEVIQLLYQNLNNVCPEAVPRGMLSALKFQFQINDIHNRFLSEELLKLLDLFKQHKIPVIPFKGPVLATSVYGNLSLRQFDDLDILVHKQDFFRAKELLISQQYKSKLTALGEVFCFKNYLQSPFAKNDEKLHLDLHWGIPPRRFHHNNRFKCLWDNLEPVSLAGQSILTFAPETALLVHCMNAAKEPWKQSLKQICDVAEIIRAYPNLNWKKVFSTAKHLDSQCLLLITVNLARQLLGVSLPEEVLRKIHGQPIVKEFTEELRQQLFEMPDSPNKKQEIYYLNKKYHLKTMGLQNKVLFYFDKLITPNTKDKNLISLPLYLDFLYYLVRPIRLARQSGVFFSKKVLDR